MKKFFKYAVMAISMMAVSTTMVSCGDDDGVIPSGGDDTPKEAIFNASRSGTAASLSTTNEILTYIAAKLPGGNYNDASITVPYQNKNKAIEILKTLADNYAWADEICQKNKCTKASVSLSYEGEYVFTYSYPHVETTGTWTGTEEGGAAWKIVMRKDARTNPHIEGAKMASVIVPEGVEIAAGEYESEWYFDAFTGYNCVISEQFYGDTYNADNTYFRIVFYPSEDGTCMILAYLRYLDEKGNVQKKIHKATVSKEQ